jgi:signal transduction histidine kinase
VAADPQGGSVNAPLTRNVARAFGWLSLVLVLLAAAAWCVAAAFDAAEPDLATRHVLQARLLTRPGGTFAAPAREIDPAELVGDWRTVDLPYTWPRMVDARAATPRVTWFEVSLDGIPAAQRGLFLYLPRWQTAGRIAVYGDRQLLYRSMGDVVWNGFNYPLWVPLDAEGTQATPRVLRERVDSVDHAGGALSSMWVGTAQDLSPRYRLRSLLQTGVADALGMIALGLGAFALAVWLLRRRERTYLLFALFTVLWVLRGLRYHVGLEPLPIPPAWFGWISVNSGNALLVTWYVFCATLVPNAPRWPTRVLLTLLVVSSIATLPLLADQAWAAMLSPMAYWVTIVAGVPSNLLMAWYAWRHGGREGIVAASIGLMHIPVALHDAMMQNYLLSPEHFYAWPLSTVARLLMFIYVILSRYVGAVDEAEQANTRLARRLREREAELADSYERLRDVQQRQVLARERQRLMQDIHDGMGSQLMSALRVAETGRMSDAQMAAVLRECIDDLKLTVDSLEPVEADLLLLLATLRYRLTPRLQGSGITLRWEVSDLPALDWLDPRSALHVLRILQEAIAGVIQQGGATELRVATTQADGGVAVVLADNGTGHGMQQEDARDKGTSNIERRAQAIGGRVNWELLAGGTRFTLWLPLHRARDDATAALTADASNSSAR